MSNDTCVWLITGAAGTLGRAMTQTIIEQGHDCIALDKDEKGLEELHDAIAAQGHRPPALYPMDLAGAGLDDFSRLADAVLGSDLGRLDHLVHGAAHFTALRPLLHQPAEEWMRITQIGIHAPIFLTQALLPALKASADPTITFITDHETQEKPAHWGAYGMSQAAREWLARALSSELGPKGPAVLMISPESFLSSIRQQAWPAFGEDHYVAVETVAKDLVEAIVSATEPTR